MTTPARFRILVAIDFSEGSLRAVEEAVRLTARLGGELELVYVVPPLSSELVGEATDGSRERHAMVELEALRGRPIPTAFAPRMHVRVGAAIPGLLATIDELRPDMVVVGSHGQSALARVFLGSVAGALVQRSAAPVLVVPDARRSARIHPGPEALTEAAAGSPSILAGEDHA